MSSKDKMIGALLIILGLIFIGLGVYMSWNYNNAINSKNQTTNIYSEPTAQTNEQTSVEIYTESDTGTVIERYVY